MSVSATFATPACDLQRAEQVLRSLPALEDIFTGWHTAGVTSLTPALQQRERVLGAATLPGASLQLLYDIAARHLPPSRAREAPVRRSLRPLHERVVRHAASLTAAETQALLPTGAMVQKTVSLDMAGRLLLCTSVGDQLLTRHHLQTIAATLALSRKALKHCTLNPAGYDAINAFGMAPGMVSPFLRPGLPTNLTAVVLLPWPEAWVEQETEVAVSLSLWESLLLPLHCLKEIVPCYAHMAYPSVPLLALPHTG